MLREIQFRIKEPFYLSVRDTLVAQIKLGKLTEDMEWSSAIDSLDTVQLMTEFEELGIEPNVPIKTVRDLLWLIKAVDSKHKRTANTPRRTR
jgi:acyl carrier protein